MTDKNVRRQAPYISHTQSNFCINKELSSAGQTSAVIENTGVNSKNTPTPRISSKEYADRLCERVQSDPSNLELNISLGEAYLRIGETEKANNAFAKAAELNPNSAFRSLIQEWNGYRYKKAGKLTKSISAYNQWAQLDDSSQPLDRWGAILASQGMNLDLLLLRSMYKKRLENGSADPELRVSFALLCYVLGQDMVSDDVSLIEWVSETLVMQYDSLPMRYLMGMLYMRINYWERAEIEFNKVIELDTEETWRELRFNLNWSSDSARFAKAQIAHIQGNISKALENCVASMRGKLKSLAPLEEIISILAERESYDSALSFLENVAPLESIPDESTELLTLYSRCYLGMGDIEKAGEICSRMEDFRQKKEQAIRAFMMNGGTDEADDEDKVFVLTGSDEKNQEEPEESEEEKEKRKLAAGLCAEKKYDEAAELLISSAEKNPANSGLSADLADALMKDGKFSQAAGVLHKNLKANRQSAGNTEIWRRLIRCYKHSGDTIKQRLCELQLQTMLPRENPLKAEIITVSVPGSSSAAIGVSARAVKGKGSISVTGVKPPEACTDTVIALLKADYEEFGLPDPRVFDLHINLRDAGADLSKNVGILDDDITSMVADSDGSCSEDVGLAMLLAAADALKRADGSVREPQTGLRIAGGRIDLSGGVYSTGTLSLGLQRFYHGEAVWRQVMLPRGVIADIERLPSTTWLQYDVSLCSNVKQAIEAWNS